MWKHMETLVLFSWNTVCPDFVTCSTNLCGLIVSLSPVTTDSAIPPVSIFHLVPIAITDIL